MADKGVNYIALAIPVFFLLIGIEVWIAYRERRPLYRFNDSINDLSCGVIQQVVGVFTHTAMFFGYVWIFEHARVATVRTDVWWTWGLAFLGVDFCYYWFHRASHEVNLIWASHIVHHQSEEYNLSVALRQSAVQPFFSAPFYWPLALAGVTPVMFLTLSSFNTLYQFWIHTRVIGRMGPFEWVFNTPSHHRVHHGSNPKYIDRNHGGTLIVWDRLFGTFQREEEEPTYGITRPLATWNPVWANLQYFVEIGHTLARAQGWRNRLGALWRGPGWRPADVPFAPVRYTPMDGRKYDARAPRALHAYIAVNFVLVIAATVALLFGFARMGWDLRATLAAWVCWSLMNLGGVLDGRPWSLASESSRLALTVVAAAWFVPATAMPPALAAATIAATAGTLLLAHHRRHFRHRPPRIVAAAPAPSGPASPATS